MYQFKIDLRKYNPEIIGKAIRQFSIKRNRLDESNPQSSFISVPGKYFLGTETEKYFRLTRIRFPFERAFPNFIIRINKDNYHDCRIFFSASSIFAVLALTILVVYIISTSFQNMQLDNEAGYILLLALGYSAYFVYEYRTSKNRFLSAIEETALHFK